MEYMFVVDLCDMKIVITRKIKNFLEDKVVTRCCEAIG